MRLHARHGIYISTTPPSSVRPAVVFQFETPCKRTNIGERSGCGQFQRHAPMRVSPELGYFISKDGILFPQTCLSFFQIFDWNTSNSTVFAIVYLFGQCPTYIPKPLLLVAVVIHKQFFVKRDSAPESFLVVRPVGSHQWSNGMVWYGMVCQKYPRFGRPCAEPLCCDGRRCRWWTQGPRCRHLRNPEFQHFLWKVAGTSHQSTVILRISFWYVLVALVYWMSLKPFISLQAFRERHLFCSGIGSHVFTQPFVKLTTIDPARVEYCYKGGWLSLASVASFWSRMIIPLAVRCWYIYQYLVVS